MTQQVAIEHFLQIRAAQIVIITFMLPVCQQRGIENDKARMRQIPLTAEFHQADLDSSVCDRAKTLSCTASVLTGYLDIPFALIKKDAIGVGEMPLLQYAFNRLGKLV